MTADANVRAQEGLPETAHGLKANEGGACVQRIRNMFANLLGPKSRTGLIAVLLLLVSVVGGCGKSDNGTPDSNSSDSNSTDTTAAKRHVPSDTFVVKGLYMRMPGDDALEACKELVASSKDLVVREDPGRGFIQTTTWVHKDTRGFQVKLFDRAYFNNNGQRYTARMIENDPEVNLALSLVDKSPKRYLSISAIKPASARRFD